MTSSTSRRTCSASRASDASAKFGELPSGLPESIGRREMVRRARSSILACIVLAALAAGCSRSGGPSESTSDGPSGTVRRGQTGKFAPVQPEPQRPGAPPSLAIPPQVFLNGKSPGNFFQFMGVPLVPMVVTENSADEEFWEHEYRVELPDSSGVVRETVQNDYVLGARSRCEEIRDIAGRNGVRAGRCLGPHYLKRTGPPEEIAPRAGYGAPSYNPPGYNPR